MIKTFKIPFLSFLILSLLGIVVNFSFNAFIQLVLIYMLINMILAMSLNVVNGYTGQFSLGHAGFMAVGAYVSAYLSSIFPLKALEEALPMMMSSSSTQLLPSIVYVVIQFLYFGCLAFAGGLFSAFSGWLVGLPSLRLKGDYLAIVTLGFSEIIRVILLNTPLVGGARGFYGITGFKDVMDIPLNFISSYFHLIFWVLAAYFIIWRLMKSTHGRAFLSVREDELAAEAMGVNTTQYKVRAFVLSSFFAGVAGSLFAHFTHYLNPASFGFSRSVDALIMVVLGGLGNMKGVIVAAAFITIVPEALRPLQNYLGVDIRMILYSLSLILIMIFMPGKKFRSGGI